MARAKIKTNILAGDGQTITEITHGGEPITEVWLDSQRLYALPKQEEFIYSTAGQWTRTIPDWADNVTFFITGGNGGGQAGNGALSSRNGEGGWRGASIALNVPLPSDKRGGTVNVVIGAGGRGGQRDSQRGGDGGDSSIEITAGGAILYQETVNGGIGGETIGFNQQRDNSYSNIRESLPGIDVTTITSPHKPGAGGKGGIFGNYGKGSDGDPGYASIIFTRGVDPGEVY